MKEVAINILLMGVGLVMMGGAWYLAVNDLDPVGKKKCEAALAPNVKCVWSAPDDAKNTEG